MAFRKPYIIVSLTIIIVLLAGAIGWSGGYGAGRGEGYREGYSKGYEDASRVVPSRPVDKEFLLDLYKSFESISPEVSLTPGAKLLLSRDAQRLWLRQPDVSPTQLKNAIIMVYGSAIIEAKKYGIATLDSIFVIKVYEDKIVPIIIKVTGDEPPDDPPPESIPTAPPVTHMIDVKALNDLRVVDAILSRYPELKAFVKL